MLEAIKVPFALLLWTTSGMKIKDEQQVRIFPLPPRTSPGNLQFWKVVQTFTFSPEFVQEYANNINKIPSSVFTQINLKIEKLCRIGERTPTVRQCLRLYCLGIVFSQEWNSSCFTVFFFLFKIISTEYLNLYFKSLRVVKKKCLTRTISNRLNFFFQTRLNFY